MFNKEFLKTLTVLYVEDDDSIRMSLSNVLTKIFSKVIICKDGDDGYKKFYEYTQEKNAKINLIISDINMPHKNGIEMVTDIRKLDQDIPIVFTTAHGESEYLMESIKLKIAYYALKPINTAELLDNISNFCMIEYNKTLVEEKSNQITQYIDIINTITSIFKVNTLGIIIEVNDLTCELLEYSKEELIGMHIDSLLQQETFDNALKLIENKDLIKIKLKLKSKSGIIFYMNTTLISQKSQYTQDITSFLYICIDQTEDEIEKQQTMQKVRKNIMQQKTKESNLLKITKDLENEIERIKASSISSKDSQLILNALAKEKQKVATLNTQILHYEEKIAKLSQQAVKIDENEKAKKIEEMRRLEEYANEKEKFQSKIIELQALVSKLEAKLKKKIVD
ncbi:MAG: hypothetical protein CSA86_00085 [Arcobacter sp.]|nr:MAG: hypothetical protein CSA86_00085 [Arcobacter sp.]